MGFSWATPPVCEPYTAEERVLHSSGEDGGGDAGPVGSTYQSFKDSKLPLR